MNKYSDTSRCSKCGNTRATSEYVPTLTSVAGILTKTKEVIIRTCTNCGCRRDELPIDHIEEAKE